MNPALVFENGYYEEAAQLRNRKHFFMFPYSYRNASGNLEEREIIIGNTSPKELVSNKDKSQVAQALY